MSSADVYRLFPSRVPFVEPSTGLLTAGALKALSQIVRLLGGEGGTLPVEVVIVPATGSPYGIAFLNASGALTSTAAAANGQILIGKTGAEPTLGTLTGTANRILITNGAGTITLSTPQDIHAAASPTFAGLTLTDMTEGAFLYSGADKLLTSTTAATNGQLLIGSTGLNPVSSTLTGTASQVVVTNGPGSITLSLPQNIALGSSPTFAGLTLSGLAARAFTYSGAGSVISSTAAATNGQLLIGSTGADPIAASLTGTANQVIVTGGAGSITLSLPQNIAPTSNVTFNQVQATTGFGCNGASPQVAASVNAAIAGAAGAAYTATEQGLINDLIAQVNKLRAALVANGIAA